jgi:peroxiredoxin
MSAYDPTVLPEGLPAPVDDGACAHLPGLEVPSVRLPATAGGPVDVADLARELTVIYIYPRSGLPGVPPPEAWDAIPGARGCTPQSCGFRDAYGELRALGAEVVGLSVQSTEDQRAFAEGNHIPFPFLSDAGLELRDALGLPTFEFEGSTLLKRVTLVLAGGRVEHVFYPVFPPDRNAAEVAEWLGRRVQQKRF